MKLFRSQSSAIQIHTIRERITHLSTAYWWIVCVIVFVFLNLANILFAIFFFVNTNIDEESVEIERGVVQTIDREHLKDILGRFEARTLKFEEQKTVPPNIPAPSF